MTRWLRNLTAALALVALAAPAEAAAPGAAAADRLDGELRARGYTKVVTRDGISVYQNRKAAMVKIVAEGVLPVPPDRFHRTLVDYERQEGRIGQLGEARVLERAADHLTVYQRLVLPIIADRDFTLRVRWGRDGDVRWVRYDALEDAGPAPVDGVVRVTHHSGRWHVRPGPEPGTSLVRFHVSIDLAGSLPSVLAKAGAGRDVPAVYGAMCRLAMEESDAAAAPPARAIAKGGEVCP